MSNDCKARMKSRDILGHTHACMGDHARYLLHYCPKCQRWWGYR